MKRLGIMVMVLLLPVLAGQVLAAGKDAAAEAEVRQAFEQILDQWRDGRFAELYDRTSGGKMTREAFTRHFADAELKPTCCWDKLQEVTVTMQTASRATLRGTVGLESARGGETKTKSFKLTKEGGVWRVSQAELTALSGGAKKKTRKRTVLQKSP
jgi:hypothetical protein